MTGGEYANLIAPYVARRFGARGLKVYREIRVGKTIIGKNRCIDVFCVCEASNKAFAIECKFQDSAGHRRREDPVRARRPATRCRWPAASPMPARGSRTACCTCSRASTHAAYCLPAPDQADTTAETKELDHLLAMHFGWWDVLVGKKKPITVSADASPSIADDRVDSQADFSNTLWPPPGA